jgi:hypothetical protein
MNAPAAAMLLDPTLLDAEWRRVAHLVTLAEATRTGQTLDQAFSAQFDATAAAVAAARRAGAWSALTRIAPLATLQHLVQLDLDIMAVALAPDARPSLASRMHALQPQIGAPYPSLALLQELLMLDSGEEVARLFERLEPSAPLIATELARVSGEGAYQMVRPTPAAARALLGRSTDLGPPPGAHLSKRRAAWDDLVLPAATLRSLRDFVAWIHRRPQTIGGWDAHPTGGPLALFCGPSGTGKSFAAAVITAELSARLGEPWALYVLDLGRIMSKYVGETEQNLNALLDALDSRRAVLQIDEADGLLGKRGEITDARDRYANLEVSHMLSRFERHAGPVILTTNLRSNIDAAFLRRFQLVIDFPPPDGAARAQLWDKLLPPGAPRADDLDGVALAEATLLSGGGIQNAAQYAAILAAEAARPLAYAHLARAVWAELNKDNRQVRKSEIGFLARYLDEVER